MPDKPSSKKLQSNKVKDDGVRSCSKFVFFRPIKNVFPLQSREKGGLILAKHPTVGKKKRSGAASSDKEEKNSTKKKDYKGKQSLVESS